MMNSADYWSQYPGLCTHSSTLPRSLRVSFLILTSWNASQLLLPVFIKYITIFKEIFLTQITIIILYSRNKSITIGKITKSWNKLATVAFFYTERLKMTYNTDLYTYIGLLYDIKMWLLHAVKHLQNFLLNTADFLRTNSGLLIHWGHIDLVESMERQNIIRLMYVQELNLDC